MKKIESFLKSFELSKRTNFISLCKALIQKTSKTMGYKDLTIPILKAYFLLKILDKNQPQNLLELGSGTTTLLFDEYSQHSQAKVTVYEHDAWWHNHVSTLLTSPTLHYHLRKVKTLTDTTEYDTEYHQDAFDFVYIDGPPVTQKFNADFYHFIEQKTLKVIVVDVRFQTVCEIIKCLLDKNKTFLVYLSKNFPKKSLPNSLPLHYIKPYMDRRHSVIYLTS